MNLCRLLIGAFGALYALALVVFLIGVFGVFGQETDPLSAAFLVILGQPWVRLAEALPDYGRLAATSLAPAITLALLWLICRYRRHGMT